MAKIAGIVGVAAIGLSLGAGAAPADHRGHRSVAVRPAVVTGYAHYVGYPSTYYPSTAYRSYGSAAYRPTATPPAYFVAMSSKAPPFSFNGSPAEPGWNWHRASLQEIDAEVRARKAAKAAGN